MGGRTARPVRPVEAAAEPGGVGRLCRRTRRPQHDRTTLTPRLPARPGPARAAAPPRPRIRTGFRGRTRVAIDSYHAFRIVPGDLGTKGGLVTDARARVLRADGSVIPGLYAAGNASAAVMGRSYAGAGSTIGPAMTFGHIAARDIAGGGL
ncbi:FAD-binding protein [Streptomyces sp. NPDC006458]|uniref:FAD-binding protein n=1 Tax=Streptomyces sp. NPDC006458 TaxID=3154302 RepID=UPI0033AB99BE